MEIEGTGVDGDELTSREGIGVADSLGIELGAWAGIKDGRKDGAGIGKALGCMEGASVEGTRDGVPVGRIVKGDRLGFGLGTSVDMPSPRQAA